MKYKKLYETTSAQELNIIKIGLAKREIPYETLYETALQVGNVAALGGRGAIISVPEDKLLMARQVLVDLELVTETQGDSSSGDLFQLFDTWTSAVPLIGKLPVAIRALLLAALILTLLYVQFLFYAEGWG